MSFQQKGNKSGRSRHIATNGGTRWELVHKRLDRTSNDVARSTTEPLLRGTKLRTDIRRPQDKFAVMAKATDANAARADQLLHVDSPFLMDSQWVIDSQRPLKGESQWNTSLSSHGIPLDILKQSCGTPIGLLWSSNGIPMAFLWKSFGIPL